MTQQKHYTTENSAVSKPSREPINQSKLILAHVQSDKIKMCQSLEAGQGRAPDTRENAIKRLWDHPQDPQPE